MRIFRKTKKGKKEIGAVLYLTLPDIIIKIIITANVRVWLA